MREMPEIRPIGEVDRGWHPPHYTPLEARLWPRLGVTAAGCWEWVGAKVQGYGRIRSADQSQVPVHRVVYELLVGPIPEGLQIDHLCRNRACSNPEHLEAVTPRVNTLRSESIQARNARKTHCPQNHPYVGDNLILRVTETHPNGNRVCRTCETARRHRRRGGVA